MFDKPKKSTSSKKQNYYIKEFTEEELSALEGYDSDAPRKSHRESLGKPPYKKRAPASAYLTELLPKDDLLDLDDDDDASSLSDDDLIAAKDSKTPSSESSEAAAVETPKAQAQQQIPSGFSMEDFVSAELFESGDLTALIEEAQLQEVLKFSAAEASKDLGASVDDNAAPEPKASFPADDDDDDDDDDSDGLSSAPDIDSADEREFAIKKDAPTPEEAPAKQAEPFGAARAMWNALGDRLFASINKEDAEAFGRYYQREERQAELLDSVLGAAGIKRKREEREDKEDEDEDEGVGGRKRGRGA